MIVCKKCGNQNGDTDDFCGSCGSFLEWTGERVEQTVTTPVEHTETTPQVEEPPAEPAASPTMVERMKGLVGGDRKAEKPTAAATAAPAEKPTAAATAASAEKVPEPATASPEATGATTPPSASAAPTTPRVTAVAKEAAPQDSNADTLEAVSTTPPQERRDAGDGSARAPDPKQDGASKTAVDLAPASPPALSDASPEASDQRARKAEALIAQQAPAAPDVAVQPKRPSEVKPQAPKPPPRKQTVRPSEKPRVKPGELICGNCGQGNAPERKFCRRCGWSLAEAAVAATPWWRRLLRRKRVAAGARPMRKQRSPAAWRALRIAKVGLYTLMGLLAAIALLGVIGPWRGGITERAGRAFDRVRLEVKPNTGHVALNALQPVRASSELPGHEAKLVADGQLGTFWSEGAPGAGEGQWLEFFFEQPVDLYKVIVTSGASGKNPDEMFEVQPRPRELYLEFRGPEKQVLGSKTISLSNEREPQTFDVRSKEVAEVAVRIVSVHGARPDGRASITEIEFFERR